MNTANHFQSSKETNDKLAEQVRARANELELRLGTWLLVGNATALLLCFSSLLNHQVCNWTVFRPLVVEFTIGMIAAFFALLLVYLSQISLHRLLNSIAIEVTYLQALSDAFLRLQQSDKSASEDEYASLQSKTNVHQANIMTVVGTRWHATSLQIAGTVSFFISAVALGWGLVSAVTLPDYAAAICAP